MSYLYRAGSEINLAIQLVDESGNLITAATQTGDILDQEGNSLGAPALLLSGSVLTVTTSPAQNQIAGPLGNRLINIEVTDADGAPHYYELFYGLDQGTLIVPGENSFDSYQAMLNAALFQGSCSVILGTAAGQRQLAMIQAYNNIARAPLCVGAAETDMSTIEEVHPAQMTAAELQALPQDILARLVRAQVIEANAILSLDPIEDRRRAGLISQSHGEVTEFYRTARPLTLPIGRETAEELGGLLCWNKKIART